MTNNQMIEKVLRLGYEIENLEEELNNKSTEIEGVEEEWIKTHACSCGLFQIPECATACVSCKHV